MGRKAEHPRVKTNSVLIGFLLAICLILIGGMVLMASVPPVSRDALTHHLALPKLYIQYGGLVELPDIPFSYYPMNLDLLYLAALYFGNDIIPKYIHLLFGLLTAWLIYQYLRARTNVPFGIIGALLWLSTPIVFRLASEVYVDLGIAFFTTATLFMIFRWINSGFKLRYLIWGGIWCGLALGTKYNALLILAILSLMIPFIRSRFDSTRIRRRGITTNTTGDSTPEISTSNIGSRQVQTAVIAAVCFVGISLVVFSPWMIRNTVLKQNPVYPMFKRIFNSEENAYIEWSRTSTMVQDISGTMAVRNVVYQESLGYIALMPLRIFFEGRDDSPRHFDGRLNPFLLIFSVVGFLPLGTLPAGVKREQRIWCWFSVLFIMMAFFTAPIRIRYLLPALPAIVALSMIGIWRIWDFSRQQKTLLVKWLTTTALIVPVIAMFSYNAAYISERFHRVKPMTYISGSVTRDAYISERIAEYPVIQYINENLSQDARILGLFLGQRRYYFDREVILNETLLRECLRNGMKTDDVLFNLRQHNITHLMLRWDLFQGWMANSLSKDERELLSQFWVRYVEQLLAINGYYLFLLRE